MLVAKRSTSWQQHSCAAAGCQRSERLRPNQEPDAHVLNQQTIQQSQDQDAKNPQAELEQPQTQTKSQRAQAALSLDIKKIDRDLFAQVAAEARQHPRLRLNHNFHREQDSVQRFLNVLQPGTYVRPHRHRRNGSGTGFECFLVLQVAIGLLLISAPRGPPTASRLQKISSTPWWLWRPTA